MKQHSQSAKRDLDDEVAEAVEHRYARRLMKSAVQGDGPSPSARAAKSDKDRFDQEMEELRLLTGRQHVAPKQRSAAIAWRVVCWRLLASARAS